MLSNKYKTALVTGASSGIGEATVKLLSEKGFKVTAIARRKSKLDKLQKLSGCETLAMDIRNTKEIEKLANHSFDIFINNAGLGRGLQRFLKLKLKIYQQR